MPRPAKVKALPGVFRLTRETRIVAADEESRRIAGLFNDFLLEQHGLRLEITSVRPSSANYLSFSQAGAGNSGPEGYHLAIRAEGIRVTGTAAGLFYGMQTLTQLLPVRLGTSIELPAIDIEDQPRFGYRGVLLDVGRHYFSVTFIKKFLDLAAQYKINRFHWHLTDDQGWRIEIKKYPKLTATDVAVSGGDASFVGFYTQEQIKDIVAYAQARFITVVPEIEMPGHSGAALAAYPELGCAPFDQAVAFCPKPETFTFLENVLSEVITLFPGPYVHIGSDEVDKEAWRRSPEAQAIIAREGLKDEDELQSYFARRIERFLDSRGKRMIGWDEILQGGLAPRAIVMSWRGEEGGIEAARQNHEVIMTPSEYTYFDYYQGDARREPLSIGGFIPLEKAYAYEPVPKQIAQGPAKIHTRRTSPVVDRVHRDSRACRVHDVPAFAGLRGGGLVAAGGPQLRRLPAPAAVSARSPRQAGRALPDSRTRGTEGLLHDLAGSRDRRTELRTFPPRRFTTRSMAASRPTPRRSIEAPLQIALRLEQPELLKLIVVSAAGPA